MSFLDVKVDAHEPPVDTTLPNWRAKMRNDILRASEETEASDEDSIEESEVRSQFSERFARAFKESVGFL